MAKRRIFSVGYLFPGGEVDVIPFESKQSLLDADVIVYEPGLGDAFSTDSYLGKPSLSERASFQVREGLAHWRQELKEAFEVGKVIFVFLAEPREVYVDTGRREYSGTGRNQKVTRIVESVSSYEALPIKLGVHPRTGQSIVPQGDLGFLVSYWAEFGEVSGYKVTIEGKFTRELLKVRGGVATVGAAVLGTQGALIFVPPPDYDEDAFSGIDPETKEEFWNEEGQKFGSRLISALANVATSIRATSAESPAPQWASGDQYRLPSEQVLQQRITEHTLKLEEIHSERQELQKQLEDAGRLRHLLYEQGKPLERAIVDALRIMGFEAQPYRDDDSEFDIVFHSAEGRFLGEAEGKDKRSINIDKFSQLERNLQEDFARDGVEEFAKGVLFGNAFRLAPLAGRGDAFTAKCITASKRLGVALVRTQDLFEPARYLLAHEDPVYAESCRKAIAITSGAIVNMPEPPVSSMAIEEVEAENSAEEKLP